MEARQNAHFEAKPSDAEATDTVIRVIPRMADLDPAAWDALAGDSPFVQHAFLHALETTGCVGPDIGWEPIHLALFRNGMLEAAMPLYVKHHSWGEFVFDWAWADAYRRHGLNYYPKLVCCVPFSPVPGPRLLAKNDDDRAMLIQAARHHAHDADVRAGRGHRHDFGFGIQRVAAEHRRRQQHFPKADNVSLAPKGARSHADDTLDGDGAHHQWHLPGGLGSVVRIVVQHGRIDGIQRFVRIVLLGKGHARAMLETLPNLEFLEIEAPAFLVALLIDTVE